MHHVTHAKHTFTGQQPKQIAQVHKLSPVVFHAIIEQLHVAIFYYLWTRSLAYCRHLSSESFVTMYQWHHEWHMPESYVNYAQSSTFQLYNLLWTDIQAQPQTKTPLAFAMPAQ